MRSLTTSVGARVAAGLMALVVVCGCQSSQALTFQPGIVAGFDEQLDTLRSIDVAKLRAPSGAIQHQAFDSYTTSGKSTIAPVAIVRNVVAVVGSEDSAPPETFPKDVLQSAAGAHPELSRLDANHVAVVATRSDRERNVIEDLMTRFGRRNVGVPAFVPVAAQSPEDWPMIVITPEMLVRFDPAAWPGIETLDLAKVQLRMPAGVEVTRRDEDDPALFFAESSSTEPSDWLAAARDLHAMPEFGGIAQPNRVIVAESRWACPQDSEPEPITDEPVATDDTPPQPAYSVVPPNITDPLFYDQWHLRNSGSHDGVKALNGQDHTFKGCPGADSGAYDAWSLVHTQSGEAMMGSSDIVIAIVDGTGVQLEHEDLKANVVPGVSRDFSTHGQAGANFKDLKIGGTDAKAAHATYCAGVAVAAANKVGGVGVAPGCRFISVRTGPTDAARAKAIRYAAKHADVISMSWGLKTGIDAGEAIVEAIQYAVKKGRPHDEQGPRGCVVVIAMTNQFVDNFIGPTPDLSATKGAIAVGRSTNKDRWGQSGYGDGMGLVAPSQAALGTNTDKVLDDGTVKTYHVSCDFVLLKGSPAAQKSGTLEITTCDLMGADGGNVSNEPSRQCFCNNERAESTNPNYTNCFGGTSASTPIVAGAAALVLSANPNLTAQEVKDILYRSGERIDPLVANYELDDDTNLKYSLLTGNGRVDAYNAVCIALNITPTIENTANCPSEGESTMEEEAPQPEASESDVEPTETEITH